MSTFIRNLPFIGQESENISCCKNAADAIKKAGLNWIVDKKPACFEYNNAKGEFLSYLENGYIIYRTDIGLALGFAKSRYKVVQNTEAFSFFDTVIVKGYASWYSAGTYDNGKNVYITAKLNTTFVVGGKDPIEVFLTFINSHEGGVGIKVILTPVRVLSGAVLQIPDKFNKLVSVIKHDNKLNSNIVDVKKLLEQIHVIMDEVKDVYNKLIDTSVTTIEVYNVLASITFSTNEYDSLKRAGFTARQLYLHDTQAIKAINTSPHKIKQFRTFVNYYFNGIKHLDYFGRAWGLYIAICGYYCNIYKPKMNDYNRVLSIFSGSIHKNCLAALEYLSK